MIHLTEMRFIIAPKINSGKNNIKANRAGYNCTVESALHTMPALPKANFITAAVSRGGGWQQRPERGESCWCSSGPSLGLALQTAASRITAGDCCHIAVQGAAAGRAERMKSFHLKSLSDIGNYQLAAVCEVFPLFQQPGCCFPACCSVEISLLSLALRCCRLWQAERVIPKVLPRASLIYLFIFPLTARPQESYSWCSINNHSRSSRISPNANLLTDSD